MGQELSGQELSGQELSGQELSGQELLGYVLPRAVIVLIAWGTTCLIMHSCTTVEPLIFYIAGGVWALVGLIAFGYLHRLRSEDIPLQVQAIAQTHQPAE
jgi:hypothetical protein